MVIFMTGATGFIGGNLVCQLCKNPSVSKIYSIYRSSYVFEHPKLSWLKGSIQCIDNMCIDEQIDVFIHCAALMDNGNNVQKVLHENLINMKEVLSFSKNHSIKRFVFFSSINVHLREQGGYAKSKIIGESLLKKSGLSYKIIRPALVFGKGKNGFTNVANYVRRLPMVPVFGNGKKLEQPIYIEELVMLSELYIMDEEWNTTNDFWGSQAYQYDAIIKMIAKHYKKHARIVHLPVRPAMTICRLLDRLGIPFPVTAEQIAHMSENLDGDMTEIYRKYPITVNDFETALAKSLEL